MRYKIDDLIPTTGILLWQPHAWSSHVAFGCLIWVGSMPTDLAVAMSTILLNPAHLYI
uniref:Uncharacterized protein n=1 Tax=Rhizophora mucronata TaxID=61149 RepID=A0A2P2IZK9_RHIMU